MKTLKEKIFTERNKELALLVLKVLVGVFVVYAYSKELNRYSKILVESSKELADKIREFN